VAIMSRREQSLMLLMSVKLLARREPARNPDFKMPDHQPSTNWATV
jgi:hypothetical protein